MSRASRDTTSEKRVTHTRLRHGLGTVLCEDDLLILPSIQLDPPLRSSLRQGTPSPIVKASFLQHVTMLTINGPIVGDHVVRRQKLLWVEESGACGGE